MLTGFKDWDVEGDNPSVSQGSTVLWEMKGRRGWDWGEEMDTPPGHPASTAGVKGVGRRE